MVATTAYGGNSPTAPPKPTAPAPPPQESPTQWATQVVGDLGINAQQDPNAVQDILSWLPNEEPTNQWWGGYGTASDPTRINPLNTGFQGFGYAGDPVTGNITSSGLGTYPTLSAAAQAVAATLGEGSYANVLSDLKSGANPQQFGEALSRSPWAGGHYAGDAWNPATDSRGPAVTGQAVGSGTPQLSSQQTQQIQSAVDAYAKQNNLSPQQASQLDQILQSIVGGGMIQSGLNQQATGDQLGYTAQQYQNTQQQAQQQYGFEQQQFGIQGEQLGITQQQLAQQAAYLKKQEQFAGQQYYGFTAKQLENEMQNLLAGYGFQKQQLGLQRQQEMSGLAASGVYNTGSRAQAETQLGLTAAEEAQQFKTSQTGIDLQWQNAARGYQQEQAGFGYQQQQIQNATAQLNTQFEQLGLSKQEAYAGLQNALTNAGLQNVMTVDQLATSLAMQQAGMSSPITSILSTLIQASPMIGALVGGSNG